MAVTRIGKNMKPLFEVKAVDRAFYEKRLADWLPARMIDIHTHIWLKRFNDRSTPDMQARTVSWPSMVAADNPVADLLETYRLLFPGKSVTPLVFASLADPKSFDAANDYVARSARKHCLPALIFSDPRWPAAELERRVAQGGFLGIKSYLTMAPAHLPAAEIRIFDFFPHQQLELMNRRGWIVMLHIPRHARLRDPVNLAQMCEIEERYPNLQLIIAHAGRAYCPEDIGDACKTLARTKRMYFDISANTNALVFRRLLETVGPKRVLFGSDLPILRMRTRRICEKGFYVNLVPKGLYGDVSGDAHMREVSAAEARRLTFFMYEELDAFGRAARAVRLAPADIEAVFHGNAAAILKRAGTPVVQQLQMVYPAGRRIPGRDLRVPAGYAIRNYREGDAARFIRLMRRAGFTTWDRKTLDALLRSALPGGIFLVVHKRSGDLAATASATHNPTEQHVAGGELGWVACDPAQRGRGLGALACALVQQRFQAAGYADIYLRTDDFRLPAIKIYLQLGWKPFMSDAGMPKRWQAVLEQLELPR
jgi:predicted TIM-barrel fold metal-dependent hydrolase/ribosomal protein S18 acetylase RimI-like enzyme